MTFRELYREFAGARKRFERDAERDVTVAWHTIRLWVQTQNDKKLPSLESQLPKRAKGKIAERQERQTPKQMRAMIGAISQFYGLPMRTVKRKKG